MRQPSSSARHHLIDPSEFLNEFFGSTSSVPIDVQHDYREAFVLNHKCAPDTDPRAFRDFAVKQSRNDPLLKQILIDAATAPSPTATVARPCPDDEFENRDSSLSVGGGIAISGRGGSGTRPTVSTPGPYGTPLRTHTPGDTARPRLSPGGSQEMQDGDGAAETDEVLIFSATLGSAATASEIHSRNKNNDNPPKMSTHTVHNSNLSGLIGCNCYNHSDIEVLVELTAAREVWPSAAHSQLLQCVAPQPYMFFDSDSTIFSRALDARVSELVERMTLAHGDSSNGQWKNDDNEEEPLDIVSVGETRQTPAIALGRITCDSEAPLNQQSAILEGNRQTSYGRTAQLFMQKVSKLFIYPGQVVAVKGVAETDEFASKFVATDVYCGVDLQCPKVAVRRLVKSVSKFGGYPVHIMASGGPYSDQRTLDLSRLERFLELVKERQPHICLLFGPFVDRSNSLIELGDLKMIGPSYGTSIAATTARTDGYDRRRIEEFRGPQNVENENRSEKNSECWIAFDDVYAEIGARIEHIVKGTTRVFIIPHHNDICHPFPIPQPPFNSELLWPRWPSAVKCTAANTAVRQPRNVELVSNPVGINVNGIRIAATSADPIGQIAAAAYCRNQTEHKFDLFCRELLTQQTFFPVIPSPFPIEPSRMLDTLFDKDLLPSVLIFAAEKFPPFAKVVQSRLFVNCGQVGSLSSPHVDMWIHPPTAHECDESKSSSCKVVFDDIPSRTRVDITKTV